MTSHFDVLIAGNGILGSAVAFQLYSRAPDLRIGLIGPFSRPGSASMAAGAMLNAYGEILDGGLEHPLQRYKFDLAREALGLWPSYFDTLSEAAGERGEPGTGQGTVIFKRDGTASNFAAVRAVLEQMSEPYEMIDPACVAGYMPARDRALEALLIPREGFVDARRLMALFARAFARGGMVIPIDDRVIQAGKDWVTLASGLRLTAPKILIAAGAPSGGLLGRTVPRIYYGIGLALLFDLPEAPFIQVLRSDHEGFDHGIHLVPQAGRLVYVGSTSDNAGGPDFTPNAMRVEALKQAAAERFDHRLAGLTPQVLLGFRPVTEDGFPLIGEMSNGLFVLTGTRRDGLHMAPVYARDMADRILTGKGTISGFEPERTPYDY